ncbi:class I SAM-dependent methyltransferase [Actomonas aquatica]|uniref:Class I SAM-dependent methyltransferase n=1 Tax=Actomonas aquatica TaxID=2866162 RepID=A0ABZ1CA91_9BACT|nr:class I SAM-dependent methyltransferase [Opitutus sp. WL0086]WRQ88322.1 class I SAM-dependent methyltransferase [Opitutus sp. WL0086]
MTNWLNAHLESLTASELVSPRDEMVQPGFETQYFTIGKRALDLIEHARLLCGRRSYRRILDLPCGHGRVMRWLRAAYPQASIVGCDLNRDGVDFCAEQFEAEPVYSVPDLRELPFDDGFDLVWCGSLLTHLPVELARQTLDCLIKWTADDGVLVFSTQGRFLSTQLARGEGDYADNADVVTLLHDYRRDGMAFQPYFEDPAGHYGLNLISPAYLQTYLQARTDVITRAFLEQAWGVQDVTVLYRKREFYAPLLG